MKRVQITEVENGYDVEVWDIHEKRDYVFVDLGEALERVATELKK